MDLSRGVLRTSRKFFPTSATLLAGNQVVIIIYTIFFPFITIKDKLRKIPDQIIELIKQAKFEDYELWYETTPGLTALAWLLGFYDTDGSYSSFNYGVLYSHSKKYLNDIKSLFEIKADIDTLVEPGTVAEILGREYVSKGMFGLRISSKDVFVKMMNSYEASLQRKRPPIY